MLDELPGASPAQFLAIVEMKYVVGRLRMDYNYRCKRGELFLSNGHKKTPGKVEYGRSVLDRM